MARRDGDGNIRRGYRPPIGWEPSPPFLRFPASREKAGNFAEPIRDNRALVRPTGGSAPVGQILESGLEPPDVRLHAAHAVPANVPRPARPFARGRCAGARALVLRGAGYSRA